MNFSITDEQELLLESLREWVSRNVDEDKIKSWYKNHGFPVEFTKSYVDNGFGMLGIPEEYGGVPVDNVTLGLVNEELYHLTGCMTPFTNNTLAMFDMIEFGSPEQIDLCMKAFTETGMCAFSLSISEPGAGSDNRNMGTVTKKQADGTYLLNGSKTWVTNGEYAKYTLVIAKDEDPSRDNNSMSLWLIDRNRAGVSTAPLTKIGQQAVPFCEVYFDNVVVTEEDRVGIPGKGFLHLMKNFEMERCLIGCQSVGLAQAAMDDAAAYVSERQCFGQPIADFQQIQEMLTDMEIKIRTMRSMVYDALWKMDQGESVKLESALVKRYVPHTANEVCHDALQIFAGLGYTDEMRVGRIWIDSRGNEIAGGTNQIMVHIAGRELAKRYAK